MAEKKTTAKAKKVDAKSEIVKANSTARANSAAKKSLTQDPYAEAKKAEKARAKASADEFIKSEFVSETIKQQYKDLETEIESKKAELVELYGIETEAASVADMISTHNLLQATLDEQAAEAAAAREDEARANEAVYRENIKDLQEQLAKTKKECREDEANFKKDLEVARTREQEEYDYNLKRTREKENNDWADEKLKRERELANREADLAERINAVEKRESKMSELETKVSEIPMIISETRDSAKAEGKAEADKSHAFEKRAMEKSAEYEKNLLQNTIDSMKKAIEDQTNKIQSLEKKLDDAYVRNQELATTVAQNSGSKTYVTTEATTTPSKK